jgi:hypothetical protein
MDCPPNHWHEKVFVFRVRFNSKRAGAFPPSALRGRRHVEEMVDQRQRADDERFRALYGRGGK